MNEVIALQEVDAIVVPLLALGHTHIGGDHQIALARIGLATHVGITLSTLDTCQLGGIHDGLAFVEVVVVKTIATERVCCKFTLVAHVAIEITIGTFLQVLSREGKCGKPHQKAQEKSS